MDNPEKLATQGERKTNKTKMLDTTIRMLNIGTYVTNFVLSRWYFKILYPIKPHVYFYC
jgi:hypothetical protein